MTGVQTCALPIFHVANLEGRRRSVLRFAPDFNERAGTIGSHAIISDRRREVPLNIVLLGHDDLPSLYALQRVIEAAPQHGYTAFFSGDLPAGRDAPDELRELVEVDARLCERLRRSGRLAKIGRASCRERV